RHAVGPVGLEAVEIMSPTERLRRLAHRLDIESVPAVVAIAPEERTRNRPVVDEVAVKFPLGVAVGIECLGYIPGFRKYDICGKVGIDGPKQDVRSVARIGVEIHHLSNGVYSRVGSAAGWHALSLRRAWPCTGRKYTPFEDSGRATQQQSVAKSTRFLLRTTDYGLRSQFRCTRTSAIWTALVAAPLRRLSATTHRLR